MHVWWKFIVAKARHVPDFMHPIQSYTTVLKEQHICISIIAFVAPTLCVIYIPSAFPAHRHICVQEMHCIPNHWCSLLVRCDRQLLCLHHHHLLSCLHVDATL